MAEQPFPMPLQDRTSLDHPLLGYSAEPARRGAMLYHEARARFLQNKEMPIRLIFCQRWFGGGAEGGQHPVYSLSFEVGILGPSEQPKAAPSSSDYNDILVTFNCCCILATVSVENMLWGELRCFQKCPFRASL